MLVRCDNQYKTGANGGTILGQSMLFGRISICTLSLVHEYEMRGSLVYLLIVKYLDLMALSWNILEIFWTHF